MVWIAVAAAVAVCLLAYGWLEAGWLRKRTLEVAVPGLPRPLDGARIAHLSDFHFGAAGSLGNRASERAAAWAAEQGADLVCITGDLVSHPRGSERFARLIGRFERPLVIHGNHDVAHTRDPFSRAAPPPDLATGTLLGHDAVVVDVRGVPVQVVGVDPLRYPVGAAHPELLADPAAPFRLLLCHFPGILGRIPAGAFHLVLSGHLHAGQIVLPLPRKRVTLAHPFSPYVSGVYRADGTVMHVSPGLGTSFVPFRFFARPEVTLLVLRRAVPSVS